MGKMTSGEIATALIASVAFIGSAVLLVSPRGRIHSVEKSREAFRANGVGLRGLPARAFEAASSAPFPRSPISARIWGGVGLVVFGSILAWLFLSQ